MSDLASVPFKAPFFRRLSTVVVMTIALLLMPIAMLLILTGPIYRKRAEGWQPISNKARYAYGGILVVWLVAATAKAFLQPGGIEGEWERSADTTLAKTNSSAANEPTEAQAPEAPAPEPEPQQQASAERLPACDAEAVTDTVKEIIEENGGSNIQTVKVEDFGRVEETWKNPEQNVRRCAAEAILNTGGTRVTFQIGYGPSGKLIVQAQTGRTAAMQYVFDKGKMEEAEAASRPRDCTPYTDNLTGKEVLPHGCR